MTIYFYFILVFFFNLYYYPEKSKFQVVQTFNSTISKMFHLRVEISRKCVKEDFTFFVRFNNNESWTIEINNECFYNYYCKTLQWRYDYVQWKQFCPLKGVIPLFLQFKIIYCQLKGLCTEFISNNQRHFKSAFNMGNHWK